MSTSLRDKINRNPKQTAAIFSGLLVLAMLLIAWQWGCFSGGGGIGTSYYTIDDGATYFEESATKIPPFKHEGKDAVRAHVFKCGDGKPFVGYLEMYTPQDKKMMEDAIAGKAPPAAYAGYSGQAMVKRPGKQYPWIGLMPGTTDMYAKTVQIMCPDGKPPERVYPD